MRSVTCLHALCYVFRKAVSMCRTCIRGVVSTTKTVEKQGAWPEAVLAHPVWA